MTTNTATASRVTISMKQRWRGLVSIVTAFSFVVTVASGVALFVAPSGRVARDTDWRCLNHDKWQWIDIHIWFSVLLCLAAIFHLVLNWRTMLTHLGTNRRGRMGIRLEWLAAIMLCIALYAAAVATSSPLTFLADLRDTFRHRQPHSTPNAAQPQADTTAHAPTSPPDTVPSGAPSTADSIDASRGRGGIGRTTLTDFCRANGLSLANTLSRLAAKGYTATENATMREIAASRNIHPRDLTRDLLQTNE